MVIALRCTRSGPQNSDPGFFLLSGSQKYTFMPDGHDDHVVHAIPDAVLQLSSYNMEYSPEHYNAGDLLSLSGKLAILKDKLRAGAVEALDLDSNTFGILPIHETRPFRIRSWKIIQPSPVVGEKPITLAEYTAPSQASPRIPTSTDETQNLWTLLELEARSRNQRRHPARSACPSLITAEDARSAP